MSCYHESQVGAETRRRHVLECFQDQECVFVFICPCQSVGPGLPGLCQNMWKWLLAQALFKTLWGEKGKTENKEDMKKEREWEIGGSLVCWQLGRNGFVTLWWRGIFHFMTYYSVPENSANWKRWSEFKVGTMWKQMKSWLLFYCM